MSEDVTEENGTTTLKRGAIDMVGQAEHREALVNHQKALQYWRNRRDEYDPAAEKHFGQSLADIELTIKIINKRIGHIELLLE